MKIKFFQTLQSFSFFGIVGQNSVRSGTIHGEVGDEKDLFQGGESRQSIRFRTLLLVGKASISDVTGKQATDIQPGNASLKGLPAAQLM